MGSTRSPLWLVAATCLSALACSASAVTNAAAATFTVDSLSDAAATANTTDGICDSDSFPGTPVCSLRAAVQESNGVPGPDKIIVPNLGSPYVLSLGGPGEDAGATGDLDINDSVTVTGTPDVVIDGDGIDRVFQVGASGFNNPVAILTQLHITNGGAVDSGAGIAVTSGSLKLMQSEVYGNAADGGAGSGMGGGIWFNSPFAQTITSSTIAANTVDSLGTSAVGGGIGVSATSGRVTAVDSTISDNTAQVFAGSSAGGGGLWASGPADLTQVTMDDNHALAPSAAAGGSIDAPAAAQVRVRGSIISAGLASPGAENCYGNVNSLGGTIETKSPAAGIQCGLFGSQGDRQVGTAGLVPLGVRGGPTRTQALLDGSPALDFVKRCYPITHDQRGFERPSGPACDAGAFERQQLKPPEICFGRRATIFGDAGANRITGTPGADVIVGLDGNDHINGGGGNDRICAGKGKDRVQGGTGRDRIAGSSQNDRLSGGRGNDLLRGEANDDQLSGGAGNDLLQGGDGRDTLVGGGGRNVLDGGRSTDSCRGGKQIRCGRSGHELHRARERDG